MADPAAASVPTASHLRPMPRARVSSFSCGRGVSVQRARTSVDPQTLNSCPTCAARQQHAGRAVHQAGGHWRAFRQAKLAGGLAGDPAGDAVGVEHFRQHGVVHADLLAQLITPAGQFQRAIDAHERGVGWIGHPRPGHAAMEERIEVPDKVSLLQALGLVVEVPRPGRRADPAGKGAAADDGQVMFLADTPFQIERDLDAAAVLMGNDRRQRIAPGVHRHPGGGHRRDVDRVDLPCGGAERGKRFADGAEKLVGVDINLGAVMAGLEEDAL